MRAADFGQRRLLRPSRPPGRRLRWLLPQLRRSLRGRRSHSLPRRRSRPQTHVRVAPPLTRRSAFRPHRPTWTVDTSAQRTSPCCRPIRTVLTGTVTASAVRIEMADGRQLQLIISAAVLVAAPLYLLREWRRDRLTVQKVGAALFAAAAYVYALTVVF